MSEENYFNEMPKEYINLFASNWSSKTRKERYDILRNAGATSKQARIGRDYGWRKAEVYIYGFKTPTGPGPRKGDRIPGYYTLLKSEKIDWWRRLSAYWNLGPYRANQEYETFNKWQKETSVKWPKKAIQINRFFWDQLSPTEKLLYPWSSAETHSAGYVVVYRHFVEGKSWQDAMEGILIRPEEAYEEDWY